MNREAKYASEGWQTKKEREAKKRAEREAYRAKRTPTLTAMIAETPKGCCIGCDMPLPKGTKPNVQLCGDPECKTLWHFVYDLDTKPLRRRALGMVPRANRDAPLPDLVTFILGRAA